MVFENAAQVLTCAASNNVAIGPAMSELSIIVDGAVAIEGDRIAAVGTRRELRRRFAGAKRVDCGGGVLTPALVDSHTHAVFGAPRFAEHELRAAGNDYMEIARRGGGIHFSVRDLRRRSQRDLLTLTRSRIDLLASYGVGTIEVKSGYGLSVADEIKMLRVIRAIAKTSPARLVPTFLGAHEIPLENRATAASRREYIDLIINEMIPAVAKERLARFADVFCEPGVYTVDESRAILTAARAAGLQIKLHADELRPGGGAELAAELRATSADHLAAISEKGIAALARSGTVATLLPATMLFLGKERQAPSRALINAGVPVALATDFNPGTSPTPGLTLSMSLGVSQLRMSAAEVFNAVTVNAAAALGLGGVAGQLAPGFSADLTLFGVSDYREVPYWLGARLCEGLWTRGKACDVHNLGVT